MFMLFVGVTDSDDSSEAMKRKRMYEAPALRKSDNLPRFCFITRQGKRTRFYAKIERGGHNLSCGSHQTKALARQALLEVWNDQVKHLNRDEFGELCEKRRRQSKSPPGEWPGATTPGEFPKFCYISKTTLGKSKQKQVKIERYGRSVTIGNFKSKRHALPSLMKTWKVVCTLSTRDAFIQYCDRNRKTLRKRETRTDSDLDRAANVLLMLPQT
jgi:hypothetical protein